MQLKKTAACALACALLLSVQPLAADAAADKPVPPEFAAAHTWTRPAQPRTDDWQLLLVNPTHSMPKGYRPEITRLPGGHGVDARCYDELTAMLQACRDAGFQPFIRSSYRSPEHQQFLYNRKVKQMQALGYKGQAAYDRAAEIVAYPGTSEHQLGLALDIVDSNFRPLDDRQEKTPAQQWLLQHSWEYGFTLRFPKDKTAVTDIIYEPWHYRYVGKTAAAAMFAQHLCLEEYLEQLAFREALPEQITRKTEDALQEAYALTTGGKEPALLLPTLPKRETPEVFTDPLVPAVTPLPGIEG